MGKDKEKILSESESSLTLGYPIIDKLLGISGLNKVYQDAIANPVDADFVKNAFRAYNVDYSIASGTISALEKAGPVVVVANHPFGGIEGLILLDLLRSARSDTKLLANYILGKIRELREHFILVDPFETKKAAKKNIAPLRESLSWLKKGGVLGVFPSGTVSHLHLSRRQVMDPVWNVNIASLVRMSKASVLPIHFHGRNSNLFQLAGVVHPLLRTVLLPRELVNRKDTSIKVDVGSLIGPEKLASFETDEELISYLRLRTDLLKSRTESKNIKKIPQRQQKKALPQKLEEIIPPVDSMELEKEVLLLPARQLLLKNNHLSVHYAYARQIPNVLREIGRLREVTYRGVSEGTGKSIDLDDFDNYYIHLFTWNELKREVVGAYRLVKTDRAIKRYGLKGLYTRTLFFYNWDLMKQLGPTIELGRSFVRPEYQRNYNSLLLLWKGIGRYVARNPQYKNLIGPVSINNEYDSVSRQLIIDYLKANNFLPELAKLIRAKHSPKEVNIRGLDKETMAKVVKTVSELSQLISDVEVEDKTVPVLLRQYLKLGGRILGFNIDPDFADVLDCLILIDLTETERKILNRYLGADGAKSFRETHGLFDVVTDKDSDSKSETIG